jgi:hypothetical protein
MSGIGYNRDGKPICNATITGPKVGRRVVLWRKQCQRRVKASGDRCWQHRRAGGGTTP